MALFIYLPTCFSFTVPGLYFQYRRFKSTRSFTYRVVLASFGIIIRPWLVLLGIISWWNGFISCSSFCAAYHLSTACLGIYLASSSGLMVNEEYIQLWIVYQLIS